MCTEPQLAHTTPLCDSPQGTCWETSHPSDSYSIWQDTADWGIEISPHSSLNWLHFCSAQTAPSSTADLVWLHSAYLDTKTMWMKKIWRRKAICGQGSPAVVQLLGFQTFGAPARRPRVHSSTKTRVQPPLQPVVVLPATPTHARHGWVEERYYTHAWYEAKPWRSLDVVA